MKLAQATVELKISVILYVLMLVASFSLYLIANSYTSPWGGYYATLESSFYTKLAVAFSVFSFVLAPFIAPKPKWFLNTYLRLFVYFFWFAMVCIANFFIFLFVVKVSRITCAFLKCGLDWGITLP